MHNATQMDIEVRAPKESTLSFDLNREPTILEIADAERFANYRLVECFNAAHSPVVFEANAKEPDQVWKFAYAFRVVPYSQEFRVTYFPGATTADLKSATNYVRAIQSGWFWQIPFTECASKAVADEVYYRLSPGRSVPRSRPVADTEDWLAACTDSDCDEQFHLVALNGDWMGCHSKDLGLKSQHLEREHGGNWRVYGGLWDELTADEAIGLANDLHWAAAECRKLNAARQTRV